MCIYGACIYVATKIYAIIYIKILRYMSRWHALVVVVVASTRDFVSVCVCACVCVCVCVCAQGGCTCGGCICGHQNSLGPARRSGQCQSLKLEMWGWVVMAVVLIWCTGAWCTVQLLACATPRGQHLLYICGPARLFFCGSAKQQRRH